MRTLIGGVGYRDLRDYSVGPLLIDALAGREWPEWISVEDLSYNPIAVVQRLEDEAADRRFTRIVFVAAVERAGRDPGELTIYRWNGALPDPDRIQTAVTEAVTGVIALDNTILIAGHFRALPHETVVIEVQPLIHAFGDELSPAVATAFGHACDVVTAAAIEETFAARLPGAPLGGVCGGNGAHGERAEIAGTARRPG